MAVVTGVGCGIGLATSGRLVALGYRVVGTSWSTDADEQIRRVGAEPIRCDVTSVFDRVRLVDTFGEIEALVCSAGGNRVMSIKDFREEDWDFVVDLNARSVFFLNQLFGRQMRRGGSIVNVASTAAKVAVPSVAVYAAAKAAVLSITRSFSIEYAPLKVRVNAELPKIIETPIDESSGR